MTTTVEYRSMTQDEAFAILRGLFENAVTNYEAVPGDFTLNTRVCDFWWICTDGTFGAWGLARVLGPLFGIRVPLREWRKALKPQRKKTIKDLCEFLSRHASVPAIAEPTFPGKQCKAAGAFLTIKQLLENRGVDTRELAPSTKLEQLSYVGFPRIWKDLIKLAPPLVNKIRSENHYDFHFILLAIVCMISTVVGGVVTGSVPATGIPWALGSMAGLIMTWKWSEKRAALPKRVTFEGLTTFRDLSTFVCDQDVSKSPNENS